MNDSGRILIPANQADGPAGKHADVSHPTRRGREPASLDQHFQPVTSRVEGDADLFGDLARRDAFRCRTVLDFAHGELPVSCAVCELTQA